MTSCQTSCIVVIYHLQKNAPKAPGLPLTTFLARLLSRDFVATLTARH